MIDPRDPEQARSAVVGPADDQRDDQDNERPDWLPANFKTTDAFLESYRQAERKIYAQGQELADMRAQIEAAQLEVHAAQLEALQYEDVPAEDAAPDEAYEPVAEEPIPPWQAARIHADRVAALNMEIPRLFQQHAPPPVNGDVLLQEAEAIVASQRLDYAEYRDDVFRRIAEQPYIVPPSAQSSPVAAAEALDRVYVHVRNDRSAAAMRQMKLNAQSADGAGGRPVPLSDGQQRWQEIQNAPLQRFSDLMSG